MCILLTATVNLMHSAGVISFYPVLSFESLVQRALFYTKDRVKAPGVRAQGVIGSDGGHDTLDGWVVRDKQGPRW